MSDVPIDAMSALRERGNELVAEERYDEAEAAFRSAIAGDDALIAAAAMVDLGNLLLGFDRLDEARELFSIASTSADRDVAAVGSLNYAHALGAAGELEQAERLYREVAEDVPSHAGDARRSLGMLLVMEERWEEAESLYRDVIARDDDDRAFASLALGMVLVARGSSIEEADASFHRAIDEGSPEIAYSALEALDALHASRRAEQDNAST